MTEPNHGKNQNELDLFPNDLEETNTAQQVGLIDDKYTQDHLLVGEHFQPEEADHFGDVDVLVDEQSISTIADSEQAFAEIQTNRGHDNELRVEAVAEFNVETDENERVQNLDEFTSPELDALEQVTDLDEFSADLPELVSIIPASDKTTVLQPDYSAELAVLAAQISLLEKQQQTFSKDITEKAGKDEIVLCRDDLNRLKSEQKSGRRNQPAPSNKPPILTYLAITLAASALLLDTGLWYQNQDSKPQAEDVSRNIDTLQAQLAASTSTINANRENLQKQLDELKAANSVTAGQITEINKTLQKNLSSAKANGVLDKKIAELNNQNQQVDAKLEDLQNKVSALKKNTVVAAPIAAAVAPKPEKKNIAPADDHWTVNLIAFKQDWYAKRKAEEYAAKGIPAKVSKTVSKGENWYRLSVDGFKSQAEATAYAAKTKKSLNLDAPWVTND